MNKTRPMEETLIAPSELRELVARLTESKVEAIPVDHPRTLASIAVETGIPVERLREMLGASRGRRSGVWRFVAAGAVILAVGLVWLAFLRGGQSAPAQAAPSAAIFNHEGLVAMDKVRFGPESGFADPIFTPSKQLPQGLSISATLDPVTWGFGDQYGSRITSQVLDAKSADIKADLQELIECARVNAARRGMAATKGFGEPGISVLGAGYSLVLIIRSSNGTAVVDIRVPLPGQGDAQEVAGIEARASDLILERYSTSLKRKP